MPASVVLPRPGGPYSSVWSSVLSFEGWLEPNEMSLLSAILEPGIPAGEHRGELQEYINTIRMQRVKDGTITQAGEDPLLTFGRIKKQNAGGQTI